MAVLQAVSSGARTLGDVVAATGLPKATAHRLAGALEAHGLLRRHEDGYALGLRLRTLGRQADLAWPLAEVATPVLAALRDETGESVQLYVRAGAHRLCV